MKFSVTFKTPDATDAAIDELKRYSETSMCELKCECCPACYAHSLIEDQVETIQEFSKKFVRYNEYITVDFDTMAGTATVRQVKE